MDHGWTEGSVVDEGGPRVDRGVRGVIVGSRALCADKPGVGSRLFAWSTVFCRYYHVGYPSSHFDISRRQGGEKE